MEAPPPSLLAGRRSLSEPGRLSAQGEGAGEATGGGCPFSGSAASPSSSASTSGGCPFAAATAATPRPGARPLWQSRLRRPTVGGEAAQLTRRALRAQDRAWTLQEVSRHRFADDGWIAVGGRVFDVTEHVVRHKGWDTGCGMTEVLSILAHLGSDCTAEFGDIHGCYPAAFAQLRAYDIGALLPEPAAAAGGGGQGGGEQD
jgi:hypothetical protein